MELFLSQTMPWLLAGLVAVLALVVLQKPLRWLGLLCLRTAGSLLALAALSPVGALVGVTLGVNLTNALVLGLLGLPGLGLLLMLRWALVI